MLQRLLCGEDFCMDFRLSEKEGRKQVGCSGLSMWKKGKRLKGTPDAAGRAYQKNRRVKFKK